MAEEVSLYVHTDKEIENVVIGIEVLSFEDDEEGMFFPVNLSPLAAIDLANNLKEAAEHVLKSDV